MFEQQSALKLDVGPTFSDKMRTRPLLTRCVTTGCACCSRLTLPGACDTCRGWTHPSYTETCARLTCSYVHSCVNKKRECCCCLFSLPFDSSLTHVCLSFPFSLSPWRRRRHSVQRCHGCLSPPPLCRTFRIVNFQRMEFYLASLRTFADTCPFRSILGR